MVRFFVACVFLAGACIAGVVLLGPMVWNQPTGNAAEGPRSSGKTDSATSSSSGTPARPVRSEPDRSAPSVDATAPVRYVEIASTTGPAQALIIQDARVLPTQKQDVPSERDGKLLFLATPVRPGDVVQPDRLLPPYEVGLLAIPVNSWTGVPEEDRVRDENQPTKFFRRVRKTDDLAPGTTAIVRQKLRFRRLEVGDHVEEGQLLGLINPALALEELAIKQAKVDAADADRKATLAMKEESKRRLDSIVSLRARIPRGVTDDDYGVAKVTVDRYQNEEVAKQSAVVQAQRELSSALTTLDMYLIRASIPGVIKTIYKQSGEAVKSLEPVLQIQNPHKLRVEAQLEVQDAVPLRRRLEQANGYRKEADRLARAALARGETGDTYAARKLRQMADEQTSVFVEVSRPEPPRAALAGHLQDVTCVGVTRGPLPRIVSGSEDHTVRLWERLAGEDRWQERGRLDHRAIVRSLACTGPGASKNLLLTGTATGVARLFDLEQPKMPEITLKVRHSGTINVVAFSPDGKLCATGGEDRAICLYQTDTHELLGKISGAHRAGVTSLVFTTKGQLVSAGKDRRLVVWNLVEGGEGGRTLEQAEAFDRRSGDVGVLGVDPTGQHVLFDEGREVRVLSLSTRKIEGTLVNPPGTAGFATLALFSPDGGTILTNGNSPGRLQLWRTPSSMTRPAELRNYVWSSGNVTSAAFDPSGTFVVTGTSDARVLVWEMPGKAESQSALKGQLTYVEEFLDTSLKRVSVRAMLDNPGWVIPGGHATLVIPPQTKR